MMHRLWVQLLQAVLGRVDMDPDTAPTELGFFLHPPPPISGPTGLLLPRGRFLSSQRITSFFFLIYLVSFARFLFILFLFFFFCCFHSGSVGKVVVISVGSSPVIVLPDVAQLGDVGTGVPVPIPRTDVEMYPDSG